MIKQKRLRASISVLQDLFQKNARKINYPLLWGYSDILLITQEVMPKFVTYCGAFAATNLFVEYAIPTSLVLSAKSLITSKQLSIKGITQLYSLKKAKESSALCRLKQDHTVITKEDFDKNYQYSLQKLLEDFPKETFFVHPIKLSQWK